ncbi:hypothetical protein PHMEG_00014511 [Phytophthora megakarya]|uniref:Uncharacterized protein n=1 Tax=Phytophthora megakarya TaxID=4795 RepID=A0A225W3S8_9STRA|nr:hypothetical protein PHMEG_00014511 [Phytophthora megakarya]
MARGSHMLSGIWKSNQATRHTMMYDWSSSDNNSMSVEYKAMKADALAPAAARCDGNLREWTQRENYIVASYLNGDLQLPHPPNFIKEVLVSEHRAMMEDMHEQHFYLTLPASLPSSVQLAKHGPQAYLYRELFIASTDKRTGRNMMRALQADVKRFSYDGIHTLSFAFYSKRAASPQLELQYAIHIYGGDKLGLTALALVCFSEAKVLDVENARGSGPDIFYNRYHTLSFAHMTCSSPLEGVTKILLNGIHVTIHHFQREFRLPCNRSLRSRHGTQKCKVLPTRVSSARSQTTRINKRGITMVEPAKRTDFCVESFSDLVTMLKQQYVIHCILCCWISATIK